MATNRTLGPWPEARALAEKAADTHLLLEDQDVEELGCWTLKLLAAQDEMLAALQQVVTLCAIGQEFSGAAQVAMNTAKAAIARATGQ